MAQKISWTELRRTIATRAGVSEKNASAFLNSLNAQIIEALKTEKQVKINGLGTFKLQAVAPRKSVNVATGEEMTIPGYNKVVFAPEAGVKELVEKNATVEVSVTAAPKKSKKAAAAAPVVNDPLEKLGAQAAEIVDILGELGQNPKEEAKGEGKKAKGEGKKAKVVTKPKKAVKTEPEVTQATAIIEPEKPEVPETPVAEPVAEPVVEPIAEPTPEPMPFMTPESKKEPEMPVVEPKKKKKHHFWRDTLICVIILLILVGIAYYFFRQEIRTYIKDFIEKNLKEQVQENDEQTNAAANGTTASFSEESALVADDTDAQNQATEVAETNAAEANVTEEVAAEKAVTKEEIAEVPADEMIVIEEQVYKKMLKTESITEGSRLAWIAKKYYGSKIYWPYLYDANKDHLTNPNLIVVGTPIRVPKLTALQKDTTNAQTMATIEHLRREAEANIR